MKLFLSVHGKGHTPTSRKQFYKPEFPARMLIKLWGKVDVLGRHSIEIDCDDPMSLDELAKEIEIIAENFFIEFNAEVDRNILIFELEGKSSKAYQLKNSSHSFGYDVYII